MDGIGRIKQDIYPSFIRVICFFARVRLSLFSSISPALVFVSYYSSYDGVWVCGVWCVIFRMERVVGFSTSIRGGFFNVLASFTAATVHSFFLCLIGILDVFTNHDLVGERVRLGGFLIYYTQCLFATCSESSILLLISNICVFVRFKDH